MKLIDMHHKYGTDKGIAHDYIKTYDKLFTDIRDTATNILEIGVMFGNSLRMWHDFFENATIMGIDDFSSKDGSGFYKFEPLNPDKVKESLKNYPRIKLGIFDCTNVALLNEFIGSTKLNVVIDDASHRLDHQLKNIENYYPFLCDGGIYVCEDIKSKNDANILASFVECNLEFKSCDVYEFNIHKKSDDRMIVITK